MMNIFVMILAATIGTNRAFVAASPQGRRCGDMIMTDPAKVCCGGKAMYHCPRSMLSQQMMSEAMLSNQLRRILADSRPSGSDSDGDGDSDSSGDLDESQSDSGSDSNNDGNSDSSEIEEVSYSMDASDDNSGSDSNGDGDSDSSVVSGQDLSDSKDASDLGEDSGSDSNEDGNSDSSEFRDIDSHSQSASDDNSGSDSDGDGDSDSSHIGLDESGSNDASDLLDNSLSDSNGDGNSDSSEDSDQRQSDSLDASDEQLVNDDDEDGDHQGAGSENENGAESFIYNSSNFDSVYSVQSTMILILLSLILITNILMVFCYWKTQNKSTPYNKYGKVQKIAISEYDVEEANISIDHTA